jgi:hypothetical protein
MKLEGACVVEVTKLIHYRDSKEDPLTPIVRTHQHHINSTMLQLIMIIIVITIITAKKIEIEEERTLTGENNA